jgi:type II secretory pathway component PulF
MNDTLLKVSLVFRGLVLLTALVVLAALLFPVFGAATLPIVLLVFLCYAWGFYAFLQYRSGVQEEVVQLLATGAEAGAPLAPLVEAWLRDRPRPRWQRVWSRMVLFVFLPGYNWIWGRFLEFEPKVRRLAELLRDGTPLPQALRSTPGVVPPGAVASAAVGESTGRLADCLRRSTRSELGPVWVDVLPRLLYPVGLLLFLFVVVAFWATFLLPRMQRIFADLQISLPEQTLQLIEIGRFLQEYGTFVTAGVLSSVLIVIVLFFSPTARWYFPVVRWIYRMSVQSRVLSMLGVLLEAGRPVPEALDLLADQEEPGGVVSERLQDVKEAVSQGRSLGESLWKAGFLSRSGVTLIQAGERARNLPWVLSELGDHLAARAVRLAQRLSLTLFPAAVVAVGVVVGFLVLGMFLPLVKIITELSG